MNKTKTILLLILLIIPAVFAVHINLNYINSTSNVAQVNIKDYQPLTGGIEGISEGAIGNMGVYLGTVFNWLIGLSISLSIIMLLISGLQYMTTDAISGKEQAKQKMQSAIIGLLLALSSFLILETINPQITNYDSNQVINNKY
jgi:hypothetical protein